MPLTFKIFNEFLSYLVYCHGRIVANKHLLFNKMDEALFPYHFIWSVTAPLWVRSGGLQLNHEASPR